MTRRVLAAGAAAMILVGPSGASAQTAGVVGTAEENAAKTQAFVFERALRGAVEMAGQQLAKQALQLVPELTLSAEEAIVRGVRLNNYGFYFDVQAPNIQSTVILWDMLARQRSRSEVGEGPGRAVSSLGTVAADPMVAPAAVFDPDREYTTHVRSALVDTLLDSSAVLNLLPSERLTVVVSGIDQPNPNPLYRANSNKLILTISGADLLELRQGRITREQAKERIVEERF